MQGFPRGDSNVKDDIGRCRPFPYHHGLRISRRAACERFLLLSAAAVLIAVLILIPVLALILVVVLVSVLIVILVIHGFLPP